MRIHLLAVGERMPGWVSEGYDEYARRLPPECRLELRELAPGRRGKNADIARAMEDEGARMLAALPRGAHVVALDVQGRHWDTETLAARLGQWMQGGQDVALLVGGPDGLAPPVLACAKERWSLSALTFPHPLVRVILAEQIYRAWTLLNNHPYHRA
ncbi:MAG: 23S rRNA (pseudouridine(1915)-N(3))-methyltransferase RlmH [Halothiobacillaceae bacterium]|jgi:23S rRNA (pseudouridine1915-N3)-methyltransferase|nr:23S rRNA (pseudouridine(1915)-N(3))-methyltransferase RlmH [Halothiobacillaceae bacterium]MDY0049996.1 23S rRNA (pseudouridine(1915)-N(3))-methyltransferase RlmH [Halothiobacillaceae bacterium]